MACETALEAGLLPCLPARELQAILILVIKLMLSVTPEISWKLQLYYIGLKREDNDPASAESLRKEIAVMEDELNTKEELTKKHTRFIQESRMQVKEQIEKQSGGAGISINIKQSLNSK